MNSNNDNGHAAKDTIKSITARIQQAINKADNLAISDLNFDYYPTTDTLITRETPSRGGLLHLGIEGKKLLKITQGYLDINTEYLSELYSQEVYDPKKDREGRVLKNRSRIIELNIPVEDKKAILNNDGTKNYVIAFPYKHSFPAYFSPRQQVIKHLTPYILLNTHSGYAEELVSLENEASRNHSVFCFESDSDFGLVSDHRLLIKYPKGLIPTDNFPESHKHLVLYYPALLSGVTTRTRHYGLSSISRQDSLHISNMTLCLSTLSNIAKSSLSNMGVEHDSMNSCVRSSLEDIKKAIEEVRSQRPQTFLDGQFASPHNEQAPADELGLS